MLISVSLNAPSREHTITIELDLITANALRKHLQGHRAGHMNNAEVKGLEQLGSHLKSMDIQNLTH